MLQRMSGLMLALGTILGAQTAQAQCATCGNPALTAGASDLGKALGEDVVETTALTLSASYSFTQFDDFIDESKGHGPADLGDVDLGADYKLQLHVFVVNAEVSHPVGLAASLAIPYGIAAYTKDGEDGSDPGLADIETRLRMDMNKLFGMWNKGAKPRLNISLGAVAPTGAFVASSDIASTDRYVSLGRGVPWGLAEFDLRGYTKSGAGWYVSGGLRKALQVYEGLNEYKFDWGNEYRLSVGGSGQIIPKKMGFGLGLDWNVRGTSLAEGVEFPNGGGQDITASGTLQGRLPGGLMGSIGLRYPLIYRVRGIQVIPDPNVFAGIAYRIGGSKTVKKGGAVPAPPKPNVLPGEVPTDPVLLALLGDNKVTIIDYWAEWCVNCMRLMPHIKAWERNNPQTTVAKMDATKWDVEAFKRFLPATPELPALDIYGADKKLIIRLGGTDVFKFRDYLPKGSDNGYPEGWKGPGEAGADKDSEEAKSDKPQSPTVAKPQAVTVDEAAATDALTTTESP
ncbi:MAG: thioredoxin domain-containing protein [Myxococcota bacterium]|nr:thioredoxin domain-containing protein [Myxococcota bacterium]